MSTNKNKEVTEVETTEVETTEVKKGYASKELSIMAKEHFKAVKLETLYGTTDGQFFSSETDANVHGKRFKLEVLEFTK